MFSFTPVSEDDVLKILASSKIKTCDLDTIPASLVKKCAGILKTHVINIINYSVKGGFPNVLKFLVLLTFSKNQVYGQKRFEKLKTDVQSQFYSKIN